MEKMASSGPAQTRGSHIPFLHIFRGGAPCLVLIGTGSEMAVCYDVSTRSKARPCLQTDGVNKEATVQSALSTGQRVKSIKTRPGPSSGQLLSLRLSLLASIPLSLSPSLFPSVSFSLPPSLFLSVSLSLSHTDSHFLHLFLLLFIHLTSPCLSICLYFSLPLSLSLAVSPSLPLLAGNPSTVQNIVPSDHSLYSMRVFIHCSDVF